VVVGGIMTIVVVLITSWRANKLRQLDLTPEKATAKA